MPLTRLVPAEPLPSDGGPLRRRPWLLGSSLLLHVLLVVLALLLARRPQEPGGAQAPSYQLLFEPNPGTPPAGQPAPQSQNPPAPSPPAPSPDDLPGPPTPSPQSEPVPDQPLTPPAPPVPPAPESPPEPATPQPAPEAAVPQTTPAPEAAAPPLPPSAEPTPDLAAPSPPQLAPAAPQVRIEPPPEEEQLPRPAVPQFAPPQPPPPLPPTPPRPRPAPPPPPQAGTFANPMDLNFGPAPSRLAAPRLNASRGSVASRSLDVSIGQPRQGLPRNDQFADARARAIGADWNRGLLAYWLQHRFYPREAAEAGDDGYVEVELTVNRAGHVIHIAVKTRSGSPFLDMAGLATWRNAQLQPLPREIPGEDYTFSLTLHYILER